ncbi:MAG: dihydroorotate dehydrogenase electron transfer subunit [Mycoplasmataceae bacterium]|nr:dihydroorotate dehydrogenase electron transfer subunit [Mycoplasmataceae bacterium]
MVKVVNCKVISNLQIANQTYELALQGPTSWLKPGKFVNLQIPGFFLRRPMSVCRNNNNTMFIIYRIVGNGTSQLATYHPGTFVNVIIDLGNSFTYDKNYGKPLIIAGGLGLGSVFNLATSFKKRKIAFDMICGFKTKDDVCYIKEVKAINPNAIFCTDDGSYGEKGNIVQIINNHDWTNRYYYLCGSTNMMKAVYRNCQRGQLSLESRMGCGFGACMGCSIKTKKGEKRICKNGPIFFSEDLLW